MLDIVGGGGKGDRDRDRDQVVREREKEREREGHKMMVDCTIQSSQEATKGQQLADQIIQFIWIGERANKCSPLPRGPLYASSTTGLAMRCFTQIYAHFLLTPLLFWYLWFAIRWMP